MRENNQSEEQYAAFISYRHKPMDMYVAKRVHWLLEHYKTPREYAKGGRLGRVFRDEEELPASSNLSASIQNALDRSRFLVVVCTPETPQSMWVEQEISYFIKKNGRENVVAVLAEGHPEESFPPALTRVLSEDGNTVEKYVEPLAVNLTDDGYLFRKKRIGKEIFRLYAAILGCPFDALWQREKRYQMRRMMLVGLALLIFTVCFSLFTLYKNLQISQKNQEIEKQNRQILDQSKEIQANSLELSNKNKEIMKREAEALVREGESLLEGGNRLRAVENAVSALSMKDGEEIYLPEGEALLSETLGMGDTYVSKWYSELVLEQETEIKYITLSDDGQRAFTADEYGLIRCYSTLNGNLLWTGDALERSGFNEIGVKKKRLWVSEKHSILLCFPNNGVTALSLSDGSMVWHYNIDVLLGTDKSDFFCVSEEYEEIALFKMSGERREPKRELVFLDIASGREKKTIPLPDILATGRLRTRGNQTAVFSESGNFLAGAVIANEDTFKYQMVCFLADIKKNEVRVLHTVSPGEDSAITFEVDSFVFGMLLEEEAENIFLLGYNGAEDKIILNEISFDGILKDEGSVSQNLLSLDYTGGFRYTYFRSDGSNVLFCLDDMSYSFDRKEGTGGAAEVPIEGNNLYMDYWSDGSSKIIILINDKGQIRYRNSGGGWLFGTICDLDRIMLFDYVGKPVILTTDYFGFELDMNFVGVAVDKSHLNKAIILRPHSLEGHKIHVLNNEIKNMEFSGEPSYIRTIPGSGHLLLASESKDGKELQFVIIDASTKKLLRQESIQNPSPALTQGDNGVIMPLADGEHIFTGSQSYDAYENEICTLYDLKGNIIITATSAGNKTSDLIGSISRLPDGRVLYAVLQKYDNVGKGKREAVRISWQLDLNKGGSLRPELKKLWAIERGYKGKDNPVCPFIKTGSNGCILVGQYSDESDYDMDSFYVYNTLTGSAQTIEDFCHGRASRIIRLAEKKQNFAVIDEDGYLRIYDIEKKVVEKKIPLPITASHISDCCFCMDDNYILLLSNTGMLYLYDIHDGQMVFCGLMPRHYGWTFYNPISTDWDVDRGRLYISKHHIGLCLDVRSWKKIMTFENIRAYCADTNEIYTIDDHFLYYKAYGTDELVSWGKEVSAILGD